MTVRTNDRMILFDDDATAAERDRWVHSAAGWLGKYLVDLEVSDKPGAEYAAVAVWALLAEHERLNRKRKRYGAE